MNKSCIIVAAGPSFSVENYNILAEKGHNICVLNYASNYLQDSKHPKFFAAADSTDKFITDYYPSTEVTKLFAKQPGPESIRAKVTNYIVTPFTQSIEWDSSIFKRKRPDGSTIPLRILTPYKTIVYAIQYLHLFAKYDHLAFYGCDFIPCGFTDKTNRDKPWYANTSRKVKDDNTFAAKAHSAHVMYTWMYWQYRHILAHKKTWTCLSPYSKLREFLPFVSIEEYNVEA